MAVNVVPRGGKVTVTLPAGAALAVRSSGIATVSNFTNYPQYPAQTVLVGNNVAGQEFLTSTYSSGATLVVEAPYGDEAYYEVGTSPAVQFLDHISGFQGLPVTAVNASGTLTVANLMGQVITSSTASPVTATLMTGTVLDAGVSMNINDWFEFSVVNTGASNAFTVATATGWTLVGAVAVALSTSGRFRVLKTAAATFTLYRVS